MIDQVGVADTDDQHALADAVRRAVHRHWPADARHKQIADPALVSELPVWAALAEVGVAGLPVAEARGGSGGRWADLAVALEVVGAAVAPAPAVAVAGAIGALDTLPGRAAEELLAAVAGGEVATVVWTAGGHGLWGVPGAVAASGDAGEITLRGTAELVLSPEAGHLLVLAEGPGGPVLAAAVSGGTAGVVVERTDTVDPTRPYATLILADAPATVLAAGETAVAAVRRSQATAGAALAAELTGVAGHCLTGAVTHAAERQQFGQPIGAFQAVKHRCAEMLAEVEQARAAARHLAALLDAGTGASDGGTELADALALALLAAGHAAHVVSNEYLQILGGIGYTWEHEVHLHLRRAAATAPLFGGATAHRRLLDPTRRPAGDARPAPAFPESGPAAELAAHVAELLPAHVERWGRDPSYQARMAWQKTLHTVGWVAPQWPVEFGGRGLGIVDQVACDRVLALHGAPAPLGGVLGLNNVAPTLMHFGTPEQQAHLPAIQAGTEVWCQGFSEPGAGSDLASLRTRAVLDGDELVVSGQKVWTSEGMEATHCLLLARTDPEAPAHRGISALLVPLDLPGITRRPIVQITGEATFAEVFFDEVRVPMSALLGPLHAGWKVTMTTLGYERAGVIELAAQLEQSVDDVVDALQGRDLDEQTRMALTDRLVEARIVGLLGSRALGRIAEGGAPGAEHSVIKLLWSRAGQKQGETHLAALGLDGVRTATGQAAQRAYLLSRAMTIAGGTTEIMRNILAERVLGMPR